MTDNDRVEALSPRPLPTAVDLDLDSYERRPEDVIPPFVVRLGGRVISMGNPEEIDWQDLIDITNPVHFLRYAVAKADRDFIVGLSLPAYKLNKLMESYQTHFKIQDRVEQIQRSERLRSV